MKVTILGCGPAGLFAAHAAVGHGADVTILSNPRKSYMRGAQYLHQPIPGLSQKPFEIEYRLEGTVDGYREKIYGPGSLERVSPLDFVGTHEAWDIREAYDAAWNEYHPLIKAWNRSERGGMRAEAIQNADRVISTIPAKALCENPAHRFLSQKVWATDRVKYNGEFIGESEGEVIDNLVICSGLPDDWWYRASRIRGWENTEYPIDKRPNYSGGIWEVEKPLATDCDCYPTIRREGRYGAWKKGVLSHEAYYNTEAILAFDLKEPVL